MRRSAGHLALLAAALLALSLALAACGGEDGGSSGPAGGGDGSPSAEQARERQQAAAPTEEEKEARQTASRFYEIVGDDRGGPERSDIDSEAFCELMSADAQRETIAYARQASGEAKDWSCEAAIDLLVRISKRSGGFKHARQARVVGVNAEGDRATASVRFGKGPITSISMVREDGEWKLAANPAR